MNSFRTESDLLGELQVPTTAYYGVQTQRALNNFKISNHKLNHYPIFVKSLAIVKLAAVETNFSLGLMEESLKDVIVDARMIQFDALKIGDHYDFDYDAKGNLLNVFIED